MKREVDKADERTLKIIYAVLEAENSYGDWKSRPEDLKNSIDKGLQQADEGQLISHEEAKKIRERAFRIMRTPEALTTYLAIINYVKKCGQRKR